MAKVNLISPWNEHYNKIAAFFKDDPYTTVLYDEEEKHIKDAKEKEVLNNISKDDKDNINYLAIASLENRIKNSSHCSLTHSEALLCRICRIR